MFQITKFTPSDRIYPIECICIRIEDILWPRQILRAVEVRAIWWGKEPCSFNGYWLWATSCGVGVKVKISQFLVATVLVQQDWELIFYII